MVKKYRCKPVMRQGMLTCRECGSPELENKKIIIDLTNKYMAKR